MADDICWNFFKKNISFFLSDHLPKFFGSENLDDAASAINDYIYNAEGLAETVVIL